MPSLEVKDWIGFPIIATNAARSDAFSNRRSPVGNGMYPCCMPMMNHIPCGLGIQSLIIKNCFFHFFQIMLIYTGGAKGVDTHVERLCHLYGHTCVVLIPPCHPRAKSLAPLTQSDLDAATPTVTQVAFRLGRQIHHPISLQYIQRNYHVIQLASLVLAVGFFDELRKHLLGGTAWSVVMAQLLGKPLYVFVVDMEQWSWWNPTLGQYQPCEGMTEEQIALPTLQDKTAIVGTREEDQAVYPFLETLFKRI